MELQQYSTCHPHPPARLSPSPMVTSHSMFHSFPHFPCLPSLSFLSFKSCALPSKMSQLYTWSNCLHSIQSAGSSTQECACLIAWAVAVTDALASLAVPQQHQNKLCTASSSSPPVSSVCCSQVLSSINDAYAQQKELCSTKRALTVIAMPWQRCAWWCIGAPGRCGRSPCCTKFAGHSGFCSGPRGLNECNGAARLRQDEPEDEPTDQLQRRSSGNATFLVIRGLQHEG